MKTFLSLTCWFLLYSSIAWGQCIPNNSEVLENDHFKALFHNDGGRFWDYLGRYGMEIPRQPNPMDGKHSGGACNFWIGGLDDQNQLHIAAPTYRQNGVDFYAGPIRSAGNYPCNVPPQVPFAYSTVFPQPFLNLADGKVLAFHYNGFSVWNPLDGTGPVNYTTGPGRTEYQAIQLPDGKVWTFGDNLGAATQRDPTQLIDTTNWVMVPDVTLNFRSRGASGTLLASGKVLIAGYNGCEEYDPITHQSLAVAPMDTPRAYHTAILLPNGNVMVFGGNNFGVSPAATPYSRRIELYDHLTQTWSQGPQTIARRVNASATLLSNGLVLIAGGTTYTNLLEYYNPTTQQITIAGYLPYNMGVHRAIMDNDEVYFVGVFGENDGEGARICKFSPTTGRVTDLQEWLQESSAVLAKPGMIIAKGQSSYQNGHLFLNTQTDRFDEQRFQRIWKVSQADIDAFRVAQGNGTLDPDQFSDIVDWPAHGETNLGEMAQMAPFVDVNQDGLYRPIQDGDYPCIRGTEMLFWVFNDAAGQHFETSGLPLGVEVHASAWRYDCASMANCPDTLLDYMTFQRYRVFNRSLTPYHNMYMANFADIDIGYYDDDFIGCDTSLGLGFVCNGDPLDDGNYQNGVHPPALGTALLTTPADLGMTHFMTYQPTLGGNGAPQTPVQYYQTMQSLWADSTPLVDNGLDGYPGTLSGTPTRYIYSGSPGFCGGPSTGWSEWSAGNTPHNPFYIQSVGPFSFPVGGVVDFTFANVWAQGNSYLNSVCRIKDATANIRAWWPSQHVACEASVGIAKPHPVLQQIAVFPNPTDGAFQMVLPDGFLGGQWELYSHSGQTVGQGEIPFGERELSLEINQVSSGVYHLRVIGNHGTGYFAKVSIQR